MVDLEKEIKTLKKTGADAKSLNEIQTKDFQAKVEELEAKVK